MTDAIFSSANDPELNLRRRQYSIRLLLAFVAVCSLAAFGYSYVQRAMRPGEMLKAAQAGNLELVRDFVRSGVDVHYRDAWDTTPLMMAASNGRIECVKYLIENGADPNERSRFNATPLIWAVENGDMEALKFLIQSGADPSLKDDDGLIAIDHARQNGRTGAVKFLESR